MKFWPKAADPESYFDDMPLTPVSLLDPSVKLAVHLRGKFAGDQPPVVCLPGYYRNMKDFQKFGALLAQANGEDQPVVCLDYQGRGRSSNRTDRKTYSAIFDAQDVGQALKALGIEKAIFVGEGHGGQVLMSLGIHHRAMIAGAILIDAAPAINAIDVVRVRDNFQRLARVKAEDTFSGMIREIWSRTYPALSPQQLDDIGLRTHRFRNGKVYSRFDPYLLTRLKEVDVDDNLEAQWHLMQSLRTVPMMMVRSEFSDQVTQNQFARLGEARFDAFQMILPGHGSPPLLDTAKDLDAIFKFIHFCAVKTPMSAIVAG